MTFAKQTSELLALAVLSFHSAAFAQVRPTNIPSDQPTSDAAVKVKGGHELGESAEQFFDEGQEKQMISACASGDFKTLNKPSRRQLKRFCSEFADERLHAMSGQRSEYKSTGDLSEMRADTFTFDGARLVKVELVYTAPAAEANYRGLRFEEILAGIKQAYGPVTNEKTNPVKDTYGVEYIAHHETWLMPQAAILVDEQPTPGGSTTVLVLTRVEYDRLIKASAQAANPLQ